MGQPCVVLLLLWQALDRVRSVNIDLANKPQWFLQVSPHSKVGVACVRVGSLHAASGGRDGVLLLCGVGCATAAPGGRLGLGPAGIPAWSLRLRPHVRDVVDHDGHLPQAHSRSAVSWPLGEQGSTAARAGRCSRR